MTLYETIFTRRQVRNYLNSPVPEDCLSGILACVSQSEQLSGQHADFKLLPAAEVSANQGASHYLLAFCDNMNCHKKEEAFGHAQCAESLYSCNFWPM